jgi:hypothetical protein
MLLERRSDRYASAVTRRVPRRIFLRGLGGACVAAPFLGSIVDRGASARPPAPPRRLVMMFNHHGCITTRFFPKKSHGALTEADLEPTTLKYLAPFVDKMLMPRGIRGMNEWTAYLTRGQGNDNHLQPSASLLTCQPVTPNSNDPFNFDRAYKFDAKPIGPSLDHVIAKQLSPGGAPLFIRVGNYPETPFSAISYSAAETLYEGVGTTAQIYNILTGLFGGGSMNPDTYRVARGKSVLDVVKNDLETLERFDMSQSDRRKLSAWKELLNQTGTTVTTQCSPEVATAFGVTRANVDAVPAAGLSRDILTEKFSGDLDGADIYSGLAALAAVCNANPVILVKYPQSYVFRGLGLTTECDSLTHRIGNPGMQGTCLPGVIDMLLKIDDFYARKFAHLVGLLDGIDEGDGTVLDNTAAVWLKDNSDGCARNLNNLPIVQVGSCRGYFKTGVAINVEDGSADLTTGSSEAVCAEGTSQEVNAVEQLTATDPSLANAPINKYYCNLMNALGVMAAPDGFPAVGGTAAVTHYGRYDRTEDFIGGDANPPTIHDPGEYSALKA